MMARRLNAAATPPARARVSRRDWTRTPDGWVLEPGWKQKRGALRAIEQMRSAAHFQGLRLGRDCDGYDTVIVDGIFQAGAGWMGGSVARPATAPTAHNKKEAPDVFGLFEKKRTCGRCGNQGRWKGEDRRCPNCQRQAQRQAAQERRRQEQDYLINWLHTRQGDQDPLTRRLRAKAAADGLDWSRPVRHGQMSHEQVVLFDAEVRQEVGA